MGVLYEEVVHYYKTVPTEYRAMEIGNNARMLVCSYARMLVHRIFDFIRLRLQWVKNVFWSE